MSWLCPCDFVPWSPGQHIVWEGVREDRGHTENCSCVRKSEQPPPPQPLIWVRGPCQGSVASADLMNFSHRQTRTQGSQALPPPHGPHTKLVGIVECQRGPGRERAHRGYVVGWGGEGPAQMWPQLDRAECVPRVLPRA